MGYASYDYYVNTYKGDFVDETSFSKWEIKAEAKLNMICSYNIDEAAKVEFSNQIASATCVLVDALAKIDYEANHLCDAESGNVKTMSSGGQSITFNNTNTLYSVVLADVKAQNKLFRDLVIEYLEPTGLMYLGG